MTAFNAVRMRVKPGRGEDYLAAHREANSEAFSGLRSFNVVKTGERDYCIIAEWDSMDALVAARSSMIATLDTFRDMLEDLGGGLGVTDPVSGDVVLKLP